MAKDYRHYNRYSQQDKDSMRTAMGEKSNENEAVLMKQTDELEGLLKNTNTKLDVNNEHLTTIEEKLDDLATNLSDTQNNIILKLDEILTAIEKLDTSLGTVDASVNKANTDIVAAIGALTVAFNTWQQPKVMTAANAYNTPGTFAFKATSDTEGTWPDASSDWAGVQIETGLDAWQIVGSNGYYIRRNDNGHTKDFSEMTKEDWTAWEKITTTKV